MANVGDMKIRGQKDNDPFAPGTLYKVVTISENGDPGIEPVGDVEPVAVDSKNRILQFRMDGELHRVGAWGPDGSIREYTAEKRPKNSDTPKRAVGETAVEVGKGAVKGAGQSVATIAKGINKIPVVGEALSPTAGVRELERMTELENTPQKVGAAGEQVAEMVLTGGPVKNAAATLATKGIPLLTKAPALLRAAPKVVAIGSEAVNAGGNAAMHGQEVAPAASFGAGGAAVGESLSPLAARLYKGAKDQYGRVLAATTKRNKATAERVVPELIKRGVVGSSEELAQKAGANVSRLGGDIDAAVQAVKDKQILVKPILEDLRRYRREFIVDGVPIDKNAVERVDELIATLEEVSSPQYLAPSMASPAQAAKFGSLNKVRQIWDSVVAKADGYGAADLAEGSLVEAKREGANAIRAELAKRQPDIAKLNTEFRLWKGLADVLEDTALRRQGQSGGLPFVFAPGGAALTGGGSVVSSLMTGAQPLESAAIGAGVGIGTYGLLNIVEKAARSGTLNTLSAVAKSRLADAIMAGNAAAVTKILGKTAAAATGQARTPTSIGDMVRGDATTL